MKRIAAFLLCSLFANGLLFAVKPVPKPEDTVKACYSYLIKNHVSGAPSAAQLKDLGQWLSPGLLDKLAKAAKERDDFIKKHGNDEKPPYVEGDLFSSTFEGATAFEIAGSADDKKAALVQVIFTYSEKGSKPFRWADRVKLTLVNGKWLIDDIIYDLPVAFGNSGTLRCNLP